MHFYFILNYSIEETWDSWQSFNNKHAKFNDWLNKAETKLKRFALEGIAITTLKTELKQWEVRYCSNVSQIFAIYRVILLKSYLVYS